MENKSRQQNIAMFGHKHCPACGEGGIEVVVEELSTRLVRLGHKVTCFNRSGHHMNGKELVGQKRKEYKGVKLESVFTIDHKGYAAMSSSISASIKAALGKYDVVHIHAEGPAFMCWLPKLFGKRVVVTIHGLDWQRTKWGRLASFYIMQGERNAAKYADEMIVLSRETQKYFKNRYGRDTVYIPNGVHRPCIRKADLITKWFNLQKDKYLLFLGRLVPEKGLKYLIEAYSGVNTDKRLVIAGFASDTDRFVRELRELARNDKRILFTGFVEGKVLNELYSNCYLYVLPSDLEGMPLSLLEAMSYGNCCLVSDIPECTEVVEDKAVCFRQGDVEDLRNKLQRLCDAPDIVRSYQAQAEDFVCRKYDWDAAVEKTLKLYQHGEETPIKTTPIYRGE